MNLSAFCIRRPAFTILLMAAILVGGISGYRTLPVSALPRVDFPTIQVTAQLPGASPETMASSVATPLERQFSTIAGVTSMTSTSFLGSAQITLQFALDRDIDGAALDVQTAISATLRRLPREMTTPPSFRKVNPADQPVLFIAVSSDTLPMSRINEYADTTLAQRISTLPGVAQVVIYGEQKYAVRIQADPDKLAAQDLSLEEVRAAAASAASSAPVGVIDGARQLFNVRVGGQPKDAAGFRDLIVVWRDGAPVRLRDVAAVSDDVQESRSIAYLNGKQSVVIAIQRQPDANTIEVVDGVRGLLPAFRSQLPAAIELTPMFDRSVSIRDATHDVQVTLFITIALVIAVIYLFLRDARATLIPTLAVPFSIVATYGAMALLDFSINNISLLALTLCVGFVVDDAIVMLENIMRHIEKGMRPFEAALQGSREIGFTIVSITLSLVAVFIPVLFMGGVVGRVFHEFAVTISVAILASGMVSLTLTPMLASRMLRARSRSESSAGIHGAARPFSPAGGEGWDEGVGRPSPNSHGGWAPSPHPSPPAGEREQARRGATFDARLETASLRLVGAYDRSLRWCLAHRFAALLFTLATLAASVAGFILAPKGFFPLEDTGFVFAQTEAAQDISFEGMVEKQRRLAEIIKADPAVENVFYAVGGGRGAFNSGRIFFGLKPRGERPPVFAVMDRLRTAAAQVEGVGMFMQPVQNIQIGGQLSKSLYQYTLQGSDLKQLYAWSEKLTAALQGEPGFRDVTSDLQLKSLQALVLVDQAKASSVGLDYGRIRDALYAAFGEAQVASLYTPSNDYAVILEVAPRFRASPEDIGKLYIRGAGGKTVPLAAVATVTRELGPLSVNHRGQLPAVTISFNLDEGMALSAAVERIGAVSERLGAPESVSSAFQGAAQVFQAAAGGQGMLILLSIVVIYIILGMLYESFIHPVTILSGLPSAGIGAVLSLVLLGKDVNVISLVGIILLIGLVKKNAIMMVDFALQARREGASPDEAITQACLLRFRPIMMTTMAALLGTLPIALGLGAGAELRQPLGVAVVGGLLTSQLLTLYITPVIYLYLEKLRARVAAL